jgi:DNA-binding transcriptional regulator/RsmH inhibitor MraZ
MGRYKRRVDNQGRFSLPKAIRQALFKNDAVYGNVLYKSQYEGAYIFANINLISDIGFSEPNVSELNLRVDIRANSRSREERITHCYPVNVSEEGRITIPVDLREELPYLDEIVIIGFGYGCYIVGKHNVW